MSTINILGPVGYNPTGNYDPTRTYEKLDVVYYQGSSYVAISDSLGQLPTNTEYWNCIATGALKQFTYDSVAEMKIDNSLEDGMYASTVGYYEANDGGAATYKITDEESETEYQEELENGLFATLIIKDTINVKQLGAKGDRISNDTNFLQEAIDYAYDKNIKVYIPSGIYNSQSLVLKVSMYGGDNSIILFQNGENFTNYELNGSKRYDIKILENITFESDKSQYWNSTDAGESYNSNVTKIDVIRKYGQRVYIGNKTTTPNNICATDESDIMNGTGQWNKYYNQWINDTDIDVNNISSTFSSITDIEDTNTITAPNGIEINKCKFIGFSVGLTLKATYNTIINNNLFTRCKIGILTQDGSTLPGGLEDSNAKITTLTVNKNNFVDLKYFGIYGDSLLQSSIIDNIFQPVNLGIVLLNAADNKIEDNYNEIIYSGVFLATNNAFRNKIERNFVNNAYSTYNVYLKYGVYNDFGEPLNNVKGYVAASTENNDFSEKYNLTKDNLFFYTNGNSIQRNKSKYAVFVTTGNGTSISTTIKSSSRVDGTMPSVTNSQKGLYFNGNEEILSIECLNGGSNVLRYYNIQGDGNPKVCYLNSWNNTDKTFDEKDLRTNNDKNCFRVVYNDGYKSS